MSIDRDLPENWCWVTVGDLVDHIEGGKSFQCEERVPRDSEVGVVKVSAVTWGVFDEDESKTCTDPKLVNPRFMIDEGDFLFSRANTIELVGACVIAGPLKKKLMLSDKILRFIVRDGMDRWLLWALRSRNGRNEIERLATGNQESMRNIGQDRIRQIQLPLAPINEQHRIVTLIESYLSNLDSVVATLERVRRNLGRYRASVLKAAVEGRMVPTEAELARKERRSFEPAPVLLQRILAERKKRWEAAGKKGKYQEPEPPDTSNLPELPEGWCWASVDQITENHDGERVPVRRSDRATRKGQYPYYGASGVIDAVDDYLFDGSFLLVGEDGANLLARATPIAFQAHGKFWVNNHAHILQVYLGLPLGYLEDFFNSIDLAPYVTGTAQPKLTQAQMNKIPVPFAPSAEQSRIVVAVEKLLDAAANAEETAGKANRRCSLLRQSILKAAFEGKLVPQDPDDEPAAVLLERIRNEREASHGAGRAGGKKARERSGREA